MNNFTKIRSVKQNHAKKKITKKNTGNLAFASN